MNGLPVGSDAWIWMGAWALVLLLAVWLLVRGSRHDERTDALETLRGRLARGEITPDEYERARHLLDS